MAQALIQHWLTVFDVPAVICSGRGMQFVVVWFRAMCKYMGVRHAKTVAYYSRSNVRAEVAGRQLFEKFQQLHIEEPGRNSDHSLWRVLQAYHDLPGPSGLSSNGILFLRDRVSRTILWMNHGNVAREANAMMSEADDMAKKLCVAMVAQHAKWAECLPSGRFTNIGSRTPCGWRSTTRKYCPGTSSSHGTYWVSYCGNPGNMCM